MALARAAEQPFFNSLKTRNSPHKQPENQVKIKSVEVISCQLKSQLLMTKRMFFATSIDKDTLSWKKIALSRI